MKIEDIEKQLSALQKRIEENIEARSIGEITDKKLEQIFNLSFTAPISSSVESGVLTGKKDVRDRIYKKVEEMKTSIFEKIDDIALSDATKAKLRSVITASKMGDKIVEAKKVDERAEKISVGTVDSRIKHTTLNIDKYQKEIQKFDNMITFSYMGSISTDLPDEEIDRKREERKNQILTEVRKLKEDYEHYLEESKKIIADSTRFEADKEKDLEELRKDIYKKIESVRILRIFLPGGKEGIEEYEKIEKDPTIIEKYLTNANYKMLQDFDFSTKREKEIREFEKKVKELEAIREKDKAIEETEGYGQTKEAVKDMKTTELDLSEFDIKNSFSYHRAGSSDDVDLTTLTDDEKNEFMEKIVESIYQKGNETIYGAGIKKLEETVRAKAEYKPIIKKGGFFSNFFRGLTGRPSLEQETLRSAVQVEIKKKIDDFAREYRENEEAKKRNAKIAEAERKEQERNSSLDEANQEATKKAREQAMKGKSAEEAMKSKKVFEDREEM